MKALPILLIGGAAAYFLTQKPKKAIANGNGNGLPKGTAQGPGGPLQWRVIATGTGEFIAQWKRAQETSWRDGAIFGSKEEAASSIVGAIEAGDIP